MNDKRTVNMQHICKPENAIKELKLIASSFHHSKEVQEVAYTLLDDPAFKVWSASSRKGKHHYGSGLLAVHTCEVVKLSMKVADFYDSCYDIDLVELYLAALFHDVGKIDDYEAIPQPPCNFPGPNWDEWEGTWNRRHIHHISSSALRWHDASKTNLYIYEKYHDDVMHAILAHHGKREFGSPVAPNSRVAWIIHLTDSLSARLYDADTFDVVHYKGD